MWATPGGSAMPGRPVTGVERAPNTPSVTVGATPMARYRFLLLAPSSVRCENYQESRTAADTFKCGRPWVVDASSSPLIERLSVFGLPILGC
ncbi:hypothetical protein EVAR_81345_1 [Eumeta japonica]|uniref:Uncharacterized protein n=1 Tax=Eumeta variegata TaxID=151549 RepID=A0A4C1XAT6_EUMVA|nr:hypothetical protein EVAR_81345_1 [Eumeta japonica]